MREARNMAGGGLSLANATVAYSGDFCRWVFDSTFASVLLTVASTAHVVVTRRHKLCVAVLLFFVLGAAAFHRDFSYLQVGPLYITEILLGLLVGLLASRGARVTRSEWPQGRAEKLALVLVIVFLMWGALRLVPSLLNAPLAATLRNFALVHYGLFALAGYFLFRRLCGTRQMSGVFVAIVFASTVTNAFRIAGYFLQFAMVEDQFTKVVAGHAALFSLFASIILLEWLLAGGQRGLGAKWRLLAAAALAINLAAVYLSGHRSGLLALAIGLLPIIAGRITPRELVRVGLVLAIIVAVLLQFAAASDAFLTIAGKYATLGAPLEEANALWRYLYWQAVLKLWSASPITGVGFAHDLGEQEPWLVEVDRADPHNSYLALLARTGMIGVGLLGVLWVLSVVVLTTLARGPQSLPGTSLARITLGCLLGISVYAAMNVTLEAPYHAPFFWLFLGMGLALSERAREEQP